MKCHILLEIRTWGYLEVIFACETWKVSKSPLDTVSYSFMLSLTYLFRISLNDSRPSTLILSMTEQMQAVPGLLNVQSSIQIRQQTSAMIFRTPFCLKRDRQPILRDSSEQFATPIAQLSRYRTLIWKIFTSMLK